MTYVMKQICQAIKLKVCNEDTELVDKKSSNRVKSFVCFIGLSVSYCANQ